MQYSVLMTVYYREKPEFLRQAVDSMFCQTVPPDELVLVCDGPLGAALDQAIASFQRQYGSRFRTLRLETNMGLGNALHRGVPFCKNEWIARMDSDDISAPDRMEKELAYVTAHPEVSVVGGQIEEFDADPSVPVDKRCVPLELAEIRETLRFKNPMNHVTTFFRKSDVMAVGGYQNYPGFEDYQLWTNLLSAGYALGNLRDCLCYVRVGDDMYRRRGGWGYFKDTVRMECFLLEKKQITALQFVWNLIVRFMAAEMPNRLRGILFHKVMRKAVTG